MALPTTMHFSEKYYPQQGITAQTSHYQAPNGIDEIYLQDANGKRIDRTAWQTFYASSGNPQGNHTADKAFDLQESTYWQALANDKSPLLVIDLGKEQTVSAVEYLPQTGNHSTGGVKACTIYVYGK